MSDEQWLREGLADAVPPPPVNPERARAAERLARRRRTTSLAVLGAAGAVAAAAVLTATLASDGDDGRADHEVASDPPPPVECPPITVSNGTAEGSAIDQPDPDAPGTVPEGATSARLCQGPGTTFDVPEAALVTDVDDLVAEINMLPGTGEPEICTMDLGPGFRIAFGYDDGSTFVVSGQLYGCRTLVVGSGYRSNPEAAQSAFLGRLAEQQPDAGGASPADTTDLACPDDGAHQFSYDEPIGGPSFEEVVSGLSAAVLCIDDGGGTELSAEIGSADLQLLAHDMATHQSTAVLRCGATPPHPAIFATDRDGRILAVFSECGTGFWRLPNAMAWMPSKDAVAILDRLVGEAR